MNATDRGGQAGLPATGLVLLILALGTVLLQRPELAGYRPSVEVQPTRPPARSPVAEARLWQDPFTAIAEHEADLREAANDYDDLDRDESHQALLNAIKEHSQHGKVIPLAAVVFSGNYFQSIEHRRRMRYAVLAALDLLDYEPERVEHILYVRNGALAPPENGADGNLTLPEILPYEWFRPRARAGQSHSDPHNASARRPLLLLWVTQDWLDKKPTERLAALAQRLELSVPGTNPLNVLGPPDSTTLRTIVEESGTVSKEDASHVRFYSYGATAADESLITFDPEQCKGANSEADQSDTTVSDCLNRRDGYLLRTITTDDRLTEVILDELERRRAAPGDAPGLSDRQQHVALVSEIDTHYGQQLPRSFLHTLDKRLKEKQREEASGHYVHRFGYLRGLDGQLPGADGNDETPEESEASQKAPRAQGSRSRPGGRHQFDYLLRLADTIKARERTLADGRGQFKVIGVLGTDVYDKLIVLQALRPLFPESIFFTTDLDASLFHWEWLRWTRNLVVVSSFGLRLASGLQPRTPPFRDSYQTSAYLSTLIALTPYMSDSEPDSTHLVDQDSLKEWLEPRIFEIGFNGPVDISAKTPGMAREPPINTENGRELKRISQFFKAPEAGPLLEDDMLYPAPKPLLPSLKSIGVSMLLFSLAVGIFIMLSVELRKSLSKSLSNAREQYLDRLREADRRTMVLTLLVLVIAGAIVAGLWFLWMALQTNQYAGEPFSWTDGVSIWPTEIIRLAAALLSVLFLVICHKSLKHSSRELETRFHLSKHRARPTGGILAVLFPRLPVNDKDSLCADDVWHRYWWETSLRRNYARAFVWTVIFYVVGFFLMRYFGFPHAPARGELSFTLNLVLVPWVVVTLFLFLTFVVSDVTRRCHDLCVSLTNKRTAWPAKVLRDLGSTESRDSGYLAELLDIRFMGRITDDVSRLIYYPFLVLLLLVVSRLSYFDNWHLPLGLKLVIVTSSIFVFTNAVLLEQAAKFARRDSLHRLADDLIKAREQSVTDERAVKQIQWIIDEIGAYRRGAFNRFAQRPLVRTTLLIIGAVGVTAIERFM